MRKVVVTELVSLDGVTEKPQEWSFSNSNAEMEEANAAGMANSAGHVGGAASRQALESNTKRFGGSSEPFADQSVARRIVALLPASSCTNPGSIWLDHAHRACELGPGVDKGLVLQGSGVDLQAELPSTRR